MQLTAPLKSAFVGRKLSPEFTEAASRLFANEAATKHFPATRVCGKDWRTNSLQGKKVDSKKVREKRSA